MPRKKRPSSAPTPPVPTTPPPLATEPPADWPNPASPETILPQPTAAVTETAPASLTEEEKQILLAAGVSQGLVDSVVPLQRVLPLTPAEQVLASKPPLPPEPPEPVNPMPSVVDPRNRTATSTRLRYLESPSTLPRQARLTALANMVTNSGLRYLAAWPKISLSNLYAVNERLLRDRFDDLAPAVEAVARAANMNLNSAANAGTIARIASFVLAVWTWTEYTNPTAEK